MKKQRSRSARLIPLPYADGFRGVIASAVTPVMLVAIIETGVSGATEIRVDSLPSLL